MGQGNKGQGNNWLCVPGWPGTCHLSRSYFSQLFPFFYFSPCRFSKSPTVFHNGRQREGFSKVGAGVGGIVCLGYLKLGVGKNGSGISFSPFHLGSSYLVNLCCHPALRPLSITVLSFLTFACLLLPSGREPSISSDTRTDSSTESYPYKHSHHESVVSHFSSDSQGTVIYNVENDSTSQSSRDTGRDLYSGPCLPDSVLHRGSPKKKKLGQVRNVCHAKGEMHRTWVIEKDERKQLTSE